MSDQISRKKLLTLTAIVIAASGLIAWGLISLYRADEGWQDQDMYEQDEAYDEELTPEDEALEQSEADPEDPKATRPAVKEKASPAKPISPR